MATLDTNPVPAFKGVTTMNINRTTLGKHIRKHNLKAGDNVNDFAMSVSEATYNKWASANWITYQGGFVVTNYAIEQLTAGKAEPKIKRPWSREAIPDVKEREKAVRAALVEEMTKRGYECGMIGWKTNKVVSVNQLNGVSTEFSLREEFGPWSYKKKPTKLRIQYGGDYHNKAQQRPEPNAGFDIKLICDDLEKVVVDRSKKDERKNQETLRWESSSALAEGINKRLDTKYSSVTCQGTKFHADKVRMKIDIHLSPEDAEEVMKLAKSKTQ